MSEWRENIERVREALNTAHPISGDDHDAVDASDAALDALTAQIEEIQRDSAYSALAATVLTAQIEELEGEVRQAAITDRALTDYFADASKRADDAERRMEELEAALADITRGCSTWSPDWSLGMIERKARAALAQSDPPED